MRYCPTGRSTFHQNKVTQNSGVVVIPLHPHRRTVQQAGQPTPKQGYSEPRCCNPTSFPLRGLSNMQVNLPPKQGYSELRRCCNPTSTPLMDHCPPGRSTFHQHRVTQNSGVVEIPLHSHWGTVQQASTFPQNTDTQSSGVFEISLHTHRRTVQQAGQQPSPKTGLLRAQVLLRSHFIHTEGLSKRQTNLPPNRDTQNSGVVVNSHFILTEGMPKTGQPSTIAWELRTQVLFLSLCIPTKGTNLPSKQSYSELGCFCYPASSPLRECPTGRSTFHQNRDSQNSGVVVIPLHSH